MAVCENDHAQGNIESYSAAKSGHGMAVLITQQQKLTKSDVTGVLMWHSAIANSLFSSSRFPSIVIISMYTDHTLISVFVLAQF